MDTFEAQNISTSIGCFKKFLISHSSCFSIGLESWKCSIKTNFLGVREQSMLQVGTSTSLMALLKVYFHLVLQVVLVVVLVS